MFNFLIYFGLHSIYINVKGKFIVLRINEHEVEFIWQWVFDILRGDMS